MPFVPVADTIQAEIRMSLDNQLIENTLYFQSRPDATDPTLVALGNSLLLWWTVNYRVKLPDSVTLREIYLTDLTTASSPTHTTPAPAPAPAGSAATPVMPNNVTIAVSFRTAARGRSFRGRNYFGALGETQISSNTVDGATQAGIVAAYQALLSGDIADDWIWGVVSRYSGGAPRAAGLFTPVTSVVITDPIVDSQRRRLPGRGR